MKKIILLALESICNRLRGKTLVNGNTYYWGKGSMYILALTALMVVGCGDYRGKGNFALAGYSDIEIDSCQYIVGYNVLAHKGNCKFCKERRQKELKELVIKLKEK